MTPRIAGILLCIAIMAGAMLRTQWLVRKARPYRLDLRPHQRASEGASLDWRRNVMNLDNYPPDVGPYFVRRMRVSIAVQLVALAAASVLLVS
jgi:hypothetical protein